MSQLRGSSSAPVTTGRAGSSSLRRRGAAEESCALRWGDIDLDDAMFVVSRSISEVGGKLCEKDPKTHRARRLFLDPSTVAILRRHAVRTRERAERFGVEVADDAFGWSVLRAARSRGVRVA